MRRSWVVLVLACNWLVGVYGCRRDAAPSTVSASEAVSASETAPTAQAPALPEPLLLVPLTESRPRPGEPKVEVALPLAPAFTQAEIPERYDDGAYSVAGLRQDPDARVAEGESGQDIIVRAYVARVYVPPKCPEGTRCPPPKQSHLWVTDAADERGLRRAMLVVNYRFPIPEWQTKEWKGQPDVVMKVGKRYTIKGRFKQFSDNGFADGRGLLEFIAYHPLDPKTKQEQPQWVYPRGASWHPLVIAQEEAANRALAERAARAAADPPSRKRSKPARSGR
jgi:hypothetical protein